MGVIVKLACFFIPITVKTFDSLLKFAQHTLAVFCFCFFVFFITSDGDIRAAPS